MSPLTLPRVAADLDGSGHVWFAAAWDGTADDETNVVWLAEPVLIPGHHWAADTAVRTDHLTIDVVCVSEILFAADVDPDALTDTEAWALVLAGLDRCGCNLKACAAKLAQAYGDAPEVTCWRMSACVLRAGRLLKVEV